MIESPCSAGTIQQLLLALREQPAYFLPVVLIPGRLIRLASSIARSVRAVSFSDRH